MKITNRIDFDAIQDLIPMIVICIYDHDYTLKFTNQKFVETFNYSTSEVVDTNIFNYINSKDYIRFADALEQLSREKEQIEIELKLNDKAGNPIDTITYLAKDDINPEITHLFCIDNSKQKSENRHLDVYKQLFSSSRELMALVGTDMKYLMVNEAYTIHFDLNFEEIINHPISVIHGDKTELIIKNLQRVLDTGEQLYYQPQMDENHTNTQYVDSLLSPYYDENGEISGVIVSSRNVTKHKKEEISLQKDMHYYKTLFHHSPDLLASVNLNTGEIIECNHTLENILGYDVGELKNKSIFDFHLKENSSNLVLAISKLKYGEVINGLELSLTSKTGELVDAHLRTTPVVEIGDDVAMFVWRDIRHQKKLAYKAFHDPLTKTLNRAGFIDSLKHSSNNDEIKSLIYIDVDNFKPLNDKFGHLEGDKFLINLANILKNNLRKDDDICRIGGDEFVILIQDISVKKVRINMQNILTKLNEFVEKTTEYKQCKLGLSIGITQLHPNEDLDFCIERADNACYQSKQKGKNQITVFDYAENINASNTSRKLEDVSIEELI